MDSLTFVSELIKTIIWPITVLVIFYQLRSPISNAINFLDKMKYKDLELEFGKRVEELAKEAKKQIPTIVETNTTKDRLIELAKISPRSAILEAWLLVEDASIKKITEKKIKISSSDKRSPLKLEQTLSKNNILDDQKLQIFNKLRNLRNASAHAVELSLDAHDAIEYVDAAIRLASLLNE